MATTIKSTALDFTSIKNSLKVHLQNSSEFGTSDYNFEASGLSSLLDVLAYNTHYNGLIANYALNESFLSTAQLRSSVVGLAGSIGYSSGSKVSSKALVNLRITGGPADTTITLPAYTTFSTSIGNSAFTFQTLEAFTATNDGSNNFDFKTSTGSDNIPIYEGTIKTKSFIAGPYSEQDIFVIPDNTLDLNTVIVKVYEYPGSSSYTTYTNINGATSISSTSTIYIIREAPNGYYELSFGNGSNLGQAPASGEKIEVTYLSTAGASGNQARSFQNGTFNPGSYAVVPTVVSASSGGLEKEGIESIRKNAPFLYAAQNRMVTAEDYAALAQRNFSGYIQDIKSWGGEDNVPPRYGAVYLSIDYFNGVDVSTQQFVQNGITDLAADLSVASFDVFYTKPVITYLETETFFQFNPKLTGETESTIKSNVRSAISTYFTSSTGTFDKTFRRSNMLTTVDAVDPSVLSSRSNIKMQQRRSTSSNDYEQPILFGTTKDYSFIFAAPIESPKSDSYTITSTNFVYNGQTCFLRNKLGSSDLQIISLSTGKVISSNSGNYVPETGVVNITGFNISSYLGSYLAIKAIPENQSAITPLRNNILEHDNNLSTVSTVVTSSL